MCNGMADDVLCQYSFWINDAISEEKEYIEGFYDTAADICTIYYEIVKTYIDDSTESFIEKISEGSEDVHVDLCCDVHLDGVHIGNITDENWDSICA